MDESELRQQLQQLHTLSYGWARSCAGTDVEAEEVLQIAYLKVLTGKARFDGRAAFKTWLFAVIHQTALAERRKLWRRRLRLMEWRRAHTSALQADHGSAALELSERQQQFQKLLARLPRRQREVLHLVFYQELTVEEAARVMGISAGAARQHYARGKQRLAEWLRLEEQTP